MKYFIDTEFIEGFHKPLFGKKRHFIDLISIGIVCEDGREYYAISNEFNSKDADKWVQDNVITPMYTQEIHGDRRNVVSDTNFHKYVGKSNKLIAEEIYRFVNPDLGFHVSAYNNSELGEGRRFDKHFTAHNVKDANEHFVAQPEFYGYYSAYDWVLFCSLFGRMIDLPAGFPMYCRDLKQMLDEKVEKMNELELTKVVYEKPNWEFTSPIPKPIIGLKEFSLSDKLKLLKNQDSYPKQENEHNALDDAKWNKKLYEFILNLK